MIGRRQFITLLGSAGAWPIAARAQQPVSMPVIGFLSAGSASARPWPQSVARFRQGLEDIGFVVDRNLAIEFRWADDRYDQLPALALDLIAHRAAVIAADSRAVLAAKAAAANVPIVFMSGSDPVRTGLVESLNHPGGNLTGVTNFTSDLNVKRLSLLHQLAPGAAVIGVLADSNAPQANASQEIQKEIQTAARSLILPIRLIEVGNESEIETALGNFSRQGGTALHILNSFLLYSQSERLAALAARYRIAASAQARVFVEAGGLMTYGTNEVEMYRQIGRYVGRILKGEKPADLPVVQPTKIDFVLNLKTARVIGVQVPPNVLALADEVIE